MRKGQVLCNGIAAGIITEDERGYTFVYNKAYLSMPDAQPVSLTLPLRQEPYTNNVMFSFFDGLIPEGWMLNIAERNWHCLLMDSKRSYYQWILCKRWKIQGLLPRWQTAF